MNKNLLLGLVILLMSNPQLSARINFRDGFIVTAKKDTIFGQIDYRTNINSSKICIFRTGLDTKEYSPDQLLGFGFINDKYFSSQVIKGTFVEVLVEGELSLYKYDYGFYIQKTGSPPYWLESKQRRDTANIRVNGVSERVVGYRDDVKWKGILSFLTSDCVDSYQSIQKMTLGEKDMTKLVIEYNLCKGVPYKDFKSKKQWIRISYGADAGATFTVLKFTQKDYQHYYLADKYESWDPSFGLSFDISSPRVNERISLQADISYFKTDLYSYIIDKQGLTTAYYETKIAFGTLAVPVLLKYSFPEGKSSFFINTGVEFDSNFDTNSSLYTELVSGSTVNTNESEAMYISKNLFGITGGIGYARSIGKMRIGAQLRYYQSGKVKTNTGYKWDLSRLSLSIILRAG